MGFNIGKIGSVIGKKYDPIGVGDMLGRGVKFPGSGPIGWSGGPVKNTMDFYKEIAPTKISNEGLGSTVGNRFDKLRSSASNRLGAAQQDMSNALTRRFAAQGGLGGGAYIKQLQLAGDAAARQKEDVLANIGVQEQAALENEQNRILQKNMAQADMDFRAKVFSFDRASKMHELDLAERQSRIDAGNNEFNRRLAEQQGRGGLLTNILGPLI